MRSCCKRAGLEHIAPHDLRRTCAKLCHTNGGELEQIQFLLGHASVLTTERYLGCKQNLGHPVNDLFDLKTNVQTEEVSLGSTAAQAAVVNGPAPQTVREEDPHTVRRDEPSVADSRFFAEWEGAA